MRVEAERVDICIRDISSRGLLLQADAPPPRGTYVEIFLPALTLVARVVWTKDRRFGVATREPMNVAAIINARPIVNSSDPRATITPSAALARHQKSLTAAAIRQRLERSRRLSTALEFGAVVAFAAVAAIVLASAIYEKLSPTFAAVGANLRGER
jgi:Flp pilus assembly pilin Flp